MKYQIQGLGQVDLTSKDFVASGGQGQVFAKGDTAYKVYTDVKAMVPTGKIQELAVLTNSNIIKPEKLLIDSKGVPAGYTMRFVKDTYSLCQLFTKAFKERNKITPDMTLNLIRKLQEIVKHIHDHKILVVDLNELNFLTSQDFKSIFAIDVDSYQTPSFPATAIMDNIRDRHTKGFSELTDWFAFAIITFNMFIGIAPYRGKHPKFKSVEERMINNVSVLDSNVSIPSVCYPFTVIPQVYLDWYKAVLNGGKRLPPPTDLHATTSLVQAIKKIVGSNNFNIEDYAEYGGIILDVLHAGGNDIAITSLGWEKKSITQVPYQSFIHVTPKLNSVLATYVVGRELKCFDLSANQEIEMNLPVDSIMRYDGRIYVKVKRNIVELVPFENLNSRRVTLLTKIAANVLSHSTQMFDGVVFQNLLGACYVSYFPATGTHQQVRVKELDTYKIVDAKFDNQVLMVVGVKQGKYDRFIFRFKDDEFDIRTICDITPSGLNFITLDNGVCIHIDEEDNVEVFSNKKNSKEIKIFDDSAIDGNMKLLKMAGRAFLTHGKKLYKFSMKRSP